MKSMTANEYYFESVSEMLEDRFTIEGPICLADVQETLSSINQYGTPNKQISYSQMAKAFTAVMKCMLEMKRAEKGKEHGHYIIKKKKESLTVKVGEAWLVRKVEDMAISVRLSNGKEITMAGEFVDDKLTVNSVEPSFSDSSSFHELNDHLKNQIKLMVSRELKMQKVNIQ